MHWHFTNLRYTGPPPPCCMYNVYVYIRYTYMHIFLRFADSYENKRREKTRNIDRQDSSCSLIAQCGLTLKIWLVAICKCICRTLVYIPAGISFLSNELQNSSIWGKWASKQLKLGGMSFNLREMSFKTAQFRWDELQNSSIWMKLNIATFPELKKKLLAVRETSVTRHEGGPIKDFP